MSRAIVDAACLVGLERIGRLDLLTETFGDVVVPTAVVEEFGRMPEGMRTRDPSHRTLVRMLRERFGAGESEVIALAKEEEGSLAILDDESARRASAVCF